MFFVGFFSSFLHFGIPELSLNSWECGQAGIRTAEDICKTYFKILLLAIKYIDNLLGTFP